VQCLNPKCRHKVVLNVDRYPGEVLVQSFDSKLTCAKSGMIGADARPMRFDDPRRLTAGGHTFDAITLRCGKCNMPRA
jgi:hypothetical protein